MLFAGNTTALLPSMNVPPCGPTTKSTDALPDEPPFKLIAGLPDGAIIIGAGETADASGDVATLSVHPAITSDVTSVLTVFQLVRRIQFVSQKAKPTTPISLFGNQP